MVLPVIFGMAIVHDRITSHFVQKIVELKGSIKSANKTKYSGECR